MTLFEQIISEVINPELFSSTENNSLIDAVNNVKRVRIVYHDREYDRYGKNERIIIPIAYGIDKRSGQPSIRAYQVAWSSKRGFNRPTNDMAAKRNPSYWRDRPHWKLFRVDRIVSWANSTKNASQSDIDAIKSDGLNRSGDDYFSTYFAVSPLCDQSSFNITNVKDYQSSKEIGPNPISKQQISTEFEPETQENEPQGTEKTVDNLSTNNYITNKPNKINAPDTVPITKSDILGTTGETNNIERTVNNYENPINKIDDNPITKDQISPKDSEFARTVNDLTNRMDNLYKDNEEENEEEEEQWQ